MQLKNAQILITGGTGSFGRQCTETLLTQHDPLRIIIFSRDEFKQDLMRKQFTQQFGEEKVKKLRFFIGDVRDRDRLIRALHGVDYVFHAAALKQVPACEYNPFEAVKTNIYGAQNVIDACLDRGVKKVIALSTDKGVNPINLYGGTKLVSDKLFSNANVYSGPGGTIFSVVRYGNVAGSRGSVIPFFLQQIKAGKSELPITDERMTRFWMTLDGAVSLVIKTLELASGGETFVYKNPSFLVTELVKAMNPSGKYNVIGIREGEKIHECMVSKDDSRHTYEYNDHYVIYPYYSWWNKADRIIPGGKLVEPDWEYNSGTNTVWLDAAELRRRIDILDIEH
jgi:UDP-N-acetylglucosamine 4,6-dehydratase/5-epimerase